MRKKKFLIPAALAAGVAIALMVILTITGKKSGLTDYELKAPKTSAYSNSALGALLFYNLLEDAGFKVERRLEGKDFPKGEGVAVIVTKGENLYHGDYSMKDLEAAGKVLIIFPKWLARPDPKRRGWVKDVVREDYFEALSLIMFLFDSENAKKSAFITEPKGEGDFSVNPLGFKPTIESPQLINGKDLRQVVGSVDGTLVGEFVLKNGKKAWILSDPDVINNHGLLKGDNLGFSLKMVEEWLKEEPAAASSRSGEITNELRPNPSPNPSTNSTRFKNRTIVFFEPQAVVLEPATPSINWKEIFSLPNVVIAFLSLVVSLILAFFGLHRYWPEEEARERLDFGKLQLIKNSARLITISKRHKEIFTKYLDLCVERLGSLLHVPKSTMKNRNDLLKILDHFQLKCESGKPSEMYYGALQKLDKLTPSQVLYYAGVFNKWKEELESGSRAPSKDIQ
ncbi:MAG: hypothetical protein LBE27_06225 [Deltaproteobacteria bacterium]|jgi:hypothetical protein|nr:hypothetical protein [Deltaproteobacteria bacterium]